MNNWEDAKRTKYLQDQIDNTPLITQTKLKGALSILKKKTTNRQWEGELKEINNTMHLRGNYE
jgi:hypothetical protein